MAKDKKKVMARNKRGIIPSRAKAGVLTDKQKRFCEEYIIDLNAKQAAIRSEYGNTPKHSGSAGVRLLNNPQVQDYIAILAKKKSKKLELTADRVLKEIMKLAFSNMEDYSLVGKDGNPHLDLSNISRDQFAAVTELTSETYVEKGSKKTVKKAKIKLSDKTKNLELLGRHLKLFTDKVEHGGELVGFLQEAIMKAKKCKR